MVRSEASSNQWIPRAQSSHFLHISLYAALPSSFFVRVIQIAIQVLSLSPFDSVYKFHSHGHLRNWELVVCSSNRSRYYHNAAFSRSGISKGEFAGIILGSIAGAATLSALVSFLIFRRRLREHHEASKRRKYSKINIKIDGVKEFTYGEMALATNNFNSSTQIGQGGYGMVYKGILTDGIVVAIKRAQEGSL